MDSFGNFPFGPHAGNATCPGRDPVDENLGWKNVGFAALFILVNGLISLYFGLGLETEYLISAARCVIQLTILGKVLQPVLEHDTDILFVFGLAALLMLISAIEVVFNKSRTTFLNIFPVVLLSIVAANALVSFLGIRFALSAVPFYAARRYIPMLGMLLGNSMSAVAVALGSALKQLTTGKEAIEMRLAFGASRWEVVREVAAEAARVALLPTLNSMSVTGLISIPGMMTGQILGGAPIDTAVRYQQIILFMISAATALAAVVSTLLCLAICIDGGHRLRLDRVYVKPPPRTWREWWGDLCAGKRAAGEEDGERRPLLGGR
ncbi:hypothetical protein DFJ74DRAFT_766760 [Hyaloraphidium curvatum]|nr:hypothetical protein DFJ74DRAFT_766760 [Hyaloraphidium curvatum]